MATDSLGTDSPPLLARKIPTINLSQFNNKSLKQLKILNKSVFPSDYPDRFYENIIEEPDMTQWAYVNDLFVGSVTMRLFEETSDLRMISLAVLPAYRRIGVGTKLLTHVVEHTKTLKINNIQISVYVPEENEAAICFFSKHCFKITDKSPNFFDPDVYPNPTGCLMTLKITLVLTVHGYDSGEIEVKIKRTTYLHELMKAYCKQKSVSFKSVHFFYKDKRISPDQTAYSLGMDDGDSISSRGMFFFFSFHSPPPTRH